MNEISLVSASTPADSSVRFLVNCAAYSAASGKCCSLPFRETIKLLTSSFTIERQLNLLMSAPI